MQTIMIRIVFNQNFRESKLEPRNNYDQKTKDKTNNQSGQANSHDINEFQYNSFQANSRDFQI